MVPLEEVKAEDELEDEETKIRIIRKDEAATQPIETNEILKEEIKKVDLEKTGDIPPREPQLIRKQNYQISGKKF